METKKILIKNILWTMLYAIFTLVVVLHHEIWADEAQVWLIAKNVSFLGLFKHLVNEGHPSFFYLIMMPFAKAGLSAVFMQIVCWISMCFSVFLLLQYSPFNRFAKFAIITSAGFLYFFPVIARSYSVIPLLVFALAILYPKAKEKPFLYAFLLVILANTHIIMFAFCALLAMFFFFESVIKNAENGLPQADCVKNKASFAIMCAGLLAVVLQLGGTTSSNAFIKFDFINLIANGVKVFSEFFINAFDEQYADTSHIMFSDLGVVLILLSVILYIFFFAALLKCDKKMFSLAFLGIGFQIAVYILGYSHWIFVTRIFCAHLIMLFCFWIVLTLDKPYTKHPKIFNTKILNTAIGCFFLITILNGLKFAVLDLFNPYSGAKETAEYIEKNIDKNNSILVTDNDPYAIALVYYLDGKYDIYSARTQKVLHYIIWDKNLYHVLDGSKWAVYAEYMREYNNDFKDKKIYAIVSDFNLYKLNVKNINDYKLLFKSKPAVKKFEGFRVLEYQP